MKYRQRPKEKAKVPIFDPVITRSSQPLVLKFPQGVDPMLTQWIFYSSVITHQQAHLSFHNLHNTMYLINAGCI